ncbi:ABC transporter permease [Lysobacter korlensis]|uniref:ABC transporter permease n=1 Tax=Lysobacter korlensis TaxID=553636 RepID=A0ABV6RWD5_9GAMM
MNPLDITRAAIGNTFRSKTRTALTVTAIFIGAFTLTITSAIGTGISTYIDNQISSVAASDALSITKASDEAPGSQSGPAPYDPESAVVGGRFEGDGSEFASGIMTVADVDAVAGVDGVLEVHPILHLAPLYIEHDSTGKYELDINPSIQMITPDLAAGSPMPEDGNHVLLTTAYLESLGFADAKSAVGQPVSIGIADHRGEIHEFEAIISGVQNETLFDSGIGLNQTLSDALREAQAIGSPADTEVGFFSATARFDPRIGEEAVSALKADLAELGYDAMTAADQIGILRAVIGGIIGVLNAFAVIALIAAGFGIINTLLMSVQERTREIGLMKAMGMGGGRIYTLFSVEAVFIGFLGSVIGALGAMGVGAVANVILAETVIADLEGLEVLIFAPIPMLAVVLLVMGIAFLAGTIPARRAARQNPITALRYE